MDWHKYHIKQAELCSHKSKDTSTKVGAVIVGPDNEIRSTGFNGFARGVRDNAGSERYDRPDKYMWTEHAERNAIYNAARVGIPLKGCRLYLNYEPHAVCPDCARAIIQSGIVEVIGPDIPFPRRGKDWLPGFEITKKMFKEAGVFTVAFENIKEIKL